MTRTTVDSFEYFQLRKPPLEWNQDSLSLFFFLSHAHTNYTNICFQTVHRDSQSRNKRALQQSEQTSNHMTVSKQKTKTSRKRTNKTEVRRSRRKSDKPHVNYSPYIYKYSAWATCVSIIFKQKINAKIRTVEFSKCKNKNISWG